MEWLNIRLTQLSAPEYLRSDPTERATWLQLLAHCAGQENGGIIRDCADWKDRVWQQIAGVTLKEVKATCRLWTWEDTDLHIWGYPGEKERLIRFNRATGRTGGITKAINRLKAQLSPEVLATLEPTLQGLEPETMLATLQATVTGKLSQPLLATVEGSLLRKGKEGEGEGERKGKELERESSASAPEQHELSLQADAIAAAYPRQDDPIGVRSLILDELRRGTTDPIAMREAVQLCAGHIRRAPGGSSNRYVPNARTFFAESQWRSPEAFEARWQMPQPEPGKHRNGHREVSTIHTAATLKEL